MSDVFVHDLVYALGDRPQSVEEAAARGLTRSPAALLRRAGFACHHVCRPPTTAYDLARRTAARSRAELAAVDLVLYATCLPLNANTGDGAAFAASRDVKDLMDFPASRLQADFGLDAATIVGIDQQACTGMLGALRVGGALLRGEPDLRRVLCVTADRFPPARRTSRPTTWSPTVPPPACCRAGGAASACSPATPSPTGRWPAPRDDEAVGAYFTYTHRLVRETLDSAGLGPDDIDWVVPQNTNPTPGRSWRGCSASTARASSSRLWPRSATSSAPTTSST